MNNAWDEVSAAIEQAKEARRALNNHAAKMADLLLDSLEHVPWPTLVKLKAKLRRFDAHTKAWKS